MEAFGAYINEHSRMLPGGKQRILIDEHQPLMELENGRCHKPTEAEPCLLPHIIMTSDVEWDLSLYDNSIDDIEKFLDTTEERNEHENFNFYG
jgi:hypothetical protein